MPHAVSLITTIAASLGLALVMGYLATRIKLPPLVGYLIAGILIGPATPGFQADIGLASQLAEMGIMLMMFGVGLHFSLTDLLAVRRIAVPGALVQVVFATALGAGTAKLWGWNSGSALVFGLALSIASTVVMLRALEDRGLLNSMNGRIAVGWLIVQDLFVILILVLLPALAGVIGNGSNAAGSLAGTSLWISIALTLGKVGAFVVFMLVVGRRLFPKLLWLVARTGSRELFTLGVISAAVGVAYGSAQLFGVSFALGAFFGGMMMRESSLSHRAAEESLPLRDAFSVLFFVSVGMLFDPRIVMDEPMKVLAVVGVIMLANPGAAIVIVLIGRYPLNTALTVSAGLSQIGEFSFILAALGVQLGLLPTEGQSLILAGAMISISLNSFVFATVEPIQRWARANSSIARALERSDDPLAELPARYNPESLTGHVLLVGHGRVGSRIANALMDRGIPFVVAEQNRDQVEALRERNIPAVSGNASEPAVLIQAHVSRASVLVIATPDTFHARKMVDIARTLNPRIETVIRTHSDDEAELFRAENLGVVFMGEHELASAMTRHVLERLEARVEALNPTVAAAQ